MLTKNQVKFITSLHDKKFRRLENAFIVEGLKMVNELLKSTMEIESVFAVKGSPFISSHPEATEITEAELKKISALTTPNEVLAVVRIPEYIFKPEELSSGPTLALDDVSDPGNLGTIIRVADWFGIKNIICSENSADCFAPKVIQATMGSFLRVKIFYRHLPDFFESLRPMDVKVYGTILNGENIFKTKLKKNAVIILGNESKGISKGLLPYIDYKVAIPSYSNGAESLNVSTAAAIICAEFMRN
jgi:TrmH family RNA methyltransferase